MQTETPIPKQLLYSQDKFVFSPAKFPAIVGTWGCGKSLAGIYSADRESQLFTNNLYLIIRKEFVDLRDSTMRDWSTEIGRPWNGDKDVIYPNGSQVMFRHGEDIDSLKNINLGGALMVQAEEMSEDNFWFILGRLRRQSGTLKLRIEANYDGHNWIHKYWKMRQFNFPKGMEGVISPSDFHLIETNTLENKANLPPQYIASLEILPARIKKRHYIGSWDDTEGMVYDEYVESRHVVEPFSIPDTWECGFVLDHGFRNPTAVLWYAIDYDGIVYIYKEHYEAEKPISYHAERIKALDNITSGIADPSLFNKTYSKNEVMYSIGDEYRDFGISLRPAFRSKEEASIARVNEFFKADRLKIFRNNQNTITEVSNWKWKELKPGVVKNKPEEPEDSNNHACDCIKYLIASRFPASDKPKDKPQERSLLYYQELKQQELEYQEALRRPRIW